MSDDLSRAPANRAVVITGASTGIGEACALRIDRLGFRVFAGVRRNEDADALREKASGRLTPVFLDVTVPASIQAAADSVTQAVGSAGLAGLVNNAGIAVAGPLEFLPVDELRRQLEVNVVGQVAVTQAFLPHLRQARGRIVNMGSIGGRLALPFLGPYAASKFALEALTDALRVELRPWGIEVAIVEPAGVATPIWQKSLAAVDNSLRAAPAALTTLYGPAIAAVKQAAANTERNGVPADDVARAVVHALTAPRPKTRYLVGNDARIRLFPFLTLLPDRLRDLIIAGRLPRYPS